MLESLYEDLYLAIRKAGLLRTISAMYYPKLSFRNHARTKGLMTYIDEQQKITNKKLNHEELAIQFFGSREKWITSFNDLLVSNYYPNSMVHNLCSNEKGKIGIPVLFINLNDNMMQVRDVFDGNFLVEGVKCQRRVTDTIILDYRDKLYARMTKFFKFELDSTLPKDWTKKQELQFYTDYTNARVETIEHLYRFNRASERTIFSANLVKGRVGNIEKQLDYCAKLVEKPIYTLDTSDWGPTYFRHGIAIDVMNLSNMTDDLYELDGKLHQCISYIYGEKYNLSYFGYPNYHEMGSLTYSKKQQIEKLYMKFI